MKTQVEFAGPIPVLRLEGRLDGYGSTVFDQCVSGLQQESSAVVVDCSQVEYLSSMGIRSLLKLEKNLAKRGGGIVFTGIRPFVAQVFASAGLQSLFRTAGSVEEAVELAGIPRCSRSDPLHKTYGAREYTLSPASGGSCAMEIWGSFSQPGLNSLTARHLTSVSLEELGVAIGIGGIGENREQAAETLGEFISTPLLAGVVPADGHCISDFQTTREPSEAMVHLAAAAGFSGSPSLIVETGTGTEISFSELVDAFFHLCTDIDESTPPVIGFLLMARSNKICGAYFKQAADIPKDTAQDCRVSDALGILAVGIAIDRHSPALSSLDPISASLINDMAGHSPGEKRFLHIHGLTLSDFNPLETGTNLHNAMAGALHIERLKQVLHIHPESLISHPVAWVFLPSVIRSGTEKLLTIEKDGSTELIPEWEFILRRIYGDAGRVAIMPIHGGYISRTFSVTSYDRDGRKMLPTVLKIGSREVSDREESAYRRYVERYILNNTTTIMGKASRGDWTGLRYNFVGINGPGSSLSWLADELQRRPLDEIVPLFESLFSNVLKPWYGQPRWETLYPYAEHNPMKLFPGILEDAQKFLGISPETESIYCEQIETALPNPFRFLKYEYPKRAGHSMPWYKTVIHGDLNLRNVLVDEKDNIFVIDFSETRIGNAVSDFARIEAILRIETCRIDDESDLKQLLVFQAGLNEPSSMEEIPRCLCNGPDPLMQKAYSVICLLRRFADRVTIFEESMIPYLVALLEWIYPVVSYRSAGPLMKRLSAFTAALICRKIEELEASRRLQP